MMKRSILIIIFIAMISLCLSGCGKEEKVYMQREEIPEHVTAELDENLKLDADVVADMPDKLYTYTASSYRPDGQLLKDVFFPDEDDVVMESIPQENYFVYTCRSADGSRYATTSGALIYMDQPPYYAVTTGYAGATKMWAESFEGIYPPESLSFCEPEESKELVRSMAEKLDIVLDTEPYVFYALDGASLDEMCQKLADEMGTSVADLIEMGFLPDYDFSNDAGCYYMLWETLAPHGEKIFNFNYNVGSGHGLDAGVGNYVMAIVSEKGLVQLFNNKLYLYDEGTLAENIIDLDMAVDKVREYYENVILTTPVIVDTISLREVAVITDADKRIFKLVPAWCIHTYHEENPNADWRFFLVNALDGEVLK